MDLTGLVKGGCEYHGFNCFNQPAVLVTAAMIFSSSSDFTAYFASDMEAAIRHAIQLSVDRTKVSMMLAYENVTNLSFPLLVPVLPKGHLVRPKFGEYRVVNLSPKSYKKNFIAHSPVVLKGTDLVCLLFIVVLYCSNL